MKKSSLCSFRVSRERIEKKIEYTRTHSVRFVRYRKEDDQESKERERERNRKRMKIMRMKNDHCVTVTISKFQDRRFRTEKQQATGRV